MATVREKLDAALRSVTWVDNVSEFLKDTAIVERIAKCHLRLATWAKQFEIADRDNPALAFVREMESSGQYVAALMGLALYRPAAASMRTMFESSLYYTYFRNHPVELATLTRDATFYMHKSDLIEYHMLHTPDFRVLQNQFGLVGRITEWYKYVSAVAHGQLPGEWVKHRSLSEIRLSGELLTAVTESFTQGEEIIHHLFLCSAGQELWNDFASNAKKALLAGIHGDIKAKLGLDAA